MSSLRRRFSSAREAVHAAGRDLVEQGVELGLVVRRSAIGGGGWGSVAPRDGPGCATTPTTARRRPRRRPAAPRRRRRRLPPPEPGHGILGIHGRLWARPMLRAVRAAVAIVTNSRTMRSVLAEAEVLQHLDADDDGADRPRRDAEEEPGERVLGDEDQEHRQLDRLEAGLRDVEQRRRRCPG